MTRKANEKVPRISLFNFLIALIGLLYLFSNLSNISAMISESVSDLIAFLVSEKSGYTSGTIITVDGGISSRNSII